jgi:hypothetical protein
VGALDGELIEYRHSIGRAKRHRVRLRVMGPLAAAEAPVVDVDETELVGWQRMGELRLSHVIDRVQEPP